MRNDEEKNWNGAEDATNLKLFASAISKHIELHNQSIFRFEMILKKNNITEAQQYVTPNNQINRVKGNVPETNIQ